LADSADGFSLTKAVTLGYLSAIAPGTAGGGNRDLEALASSLCEESRAVEISVSGDIGERLVLIVRSRDESGPSGIFLVESCG
jgi:hypothetical protein